MYWTLTAAILLLLLPGLALALALGLRGWSAAGAAPVLTFALIVLAVLVVSLLGVNWSLLTFGVVAAGGVGLALVGALVQRRSAQVTTAADTASAATTATSDRERIWSWLTVLGIVVGAVVGMVTSAGGTSRLTDPNQGFDALYHVNLVETILRTGEVSPSVASSLNGYPDGVSIYPDAFHAMAALIAAASGTTLTSINAIMACLPLLIGLGMVALLRAQGLTRAAAVVPVVLATMTGFPIDLTWRGPIWVFVLGVSLVPSFLVLLQAALACRRVPVTVGLGLSAGGLALVHPSAALSAALLSICLLGARWLTDPTRARLDLVVLLPSGLLAVLIALPLVGRAVVDTGAGTVVDWPVAQTAGTAVGELLLFNYDTDDAQLWLAIPALIGLVVGWRTRSLRWWYVGVSINTLLCVLAASYEGWLVEILTGPWWNDRFRFAGLVYLGLSVFAAVGTVAIGTAIGRIALAASARLRRGDHDRPSPVRAARTRELASAGAVLAAVLVMGLSSGFYVATNEARLDEAYGLDVGGTISSDDLAAFAVLRDLAGTGPVLNDPNDGSAWMWVLADVRPVFGAALTKPVKPPLPEARQLLVDRLNCLDSDEQVRAAITELGVRYVYASATTITPPPTPNAGFRDLDSVASLKSVYRNDTTVIYEIKPVPLRRTHGSACNPA